MPHPHGIDREHGIMAGKARNLLALGAAALLCSATPVIAAETNDDVRFGTVHFQTSCNDVAQRRFDRAMRYEHRSGTAKRGRFSRKRLRRIPPVRSRIGELRSAFCLTHTLPRLSLI